MGWAIFRENYKGRGWFSEIASFMNQAGRFLNNVNAGGAARAELNAAGGVDIVVDEVGGRGGASAAALLQPFAVTDVSEDATLAIAVRAGGVNNRILSADRMLIPSSGVVFIELDIDKESGNIDEAALKFDAELPEQSSTKAAITLASVEIVEGSEETQSLVRRQVVTHSLWYYRCGSEDDFHHLFGAV